MNVDLMRKIDYWIGVLVCWFFSGTNRVANVFRRPPKKPIDNVDKVLFIQISEMGSTIMAYESIRYVKEKYPDAKIYYLIFNEMVDSIRMLNVISEENIITIRGKSFAGFVVDTLKAIRRLRREKIDVAFDLELFSRASNILSYMSGSRNRVGFHKYCMEGLYRGNFMTHKVSYNPHQHISLNFLSLVHAIEAPENEVPLLKKSFGIEKVDPPKIVSTKEEKENMFNKLRSINPKLTKKHKMILLNPNASQLIPIRRWPLASYVELAKKLLSDKKVFLVITGVAGEKADAQAICNAVGTDRCIDLTGKTRNIRELIDLYNISDLLITNDSGPAHFASTTQIKIIAFFGPETPKIYGPLSRNCKVMYSNFSCSPCVSAYNHRKTPCNDNKCLQVITPDEVYKVVKSLKI